MLVGQEGVTPIEDNMIKMVEQFKTQVEQLVGQKFKTFKPISYTTTVMGGRLNKFKIEVDGGKQLFVSIMEEMAGGGGKRTLEEAGFEKGP